jgi:hypothetical protein
MSETLTTRQAEAILARCRAHPTDRISGATVACLATELLALRKRVEGLEGALTPTAATKAAYMGEFTIVVERMSDDMEPDDEAAGAPDPYEHIQVPWTTIKEIMAAIRVFALATPKDHPS